MYIITIKNPEYNDLSVEFNANMSIAAIMAGFDFLFAGVGNEIIAEKLVGLLAAFSSTTSEKFIFAILEWKDRKAQYQY